MSGTLIIGKPGAGKTALMTHFLETAYKREGRQRFEACKAMIETMNTRRVHKLALPDRPPIFASYAVEFLCDYRKTFKPYDFNPFYFGIDHGEQKHVQYVLPYSVIFMPEAQGIFDSRQSSTFPRWISEAYEKHRQFHIDFYIDAQRPMLIDRNVRELLDRILLVEKLEHEAGIWGGIRKTRFHCREFSSNFELERHLENGIGGKEVVIEHRGNIFNDYDSFHEGANFVPPDEAGKDFTLHESLEQGEKPPKGLEWFYNRGEPWEFRHPKSETKKEKGEKKK